MTSKQETNICKAVLHSTKIILNSKVPSGNPILDIYCTRNYLRKQSFIGSAPSLSGHFHTLLV